MPKTNESTWRGTVIGGKIKLRDPSGFAKTVQLFEGKDVKLVLGKHIDQRTLNQNALYWAYLWEVIKETHGIATRDQTEALHEYLKRQLLPPITEKIKLPNGKEITYIRPKSTTELDKLEFTQYLNAVETLLGYPIKSYVQ